MFKINEHDLNINIFYTKISVPTFSIISKLIFIFIFKKNGRFYYGTYYRTRTCTFYLRDINLVPMGMVLLMFFVF